jgi:rhodanese-related sulfurtransferase
MTVLTVDAATLTGWIARGEAVVIDVREPAEFAGGHIPGSLSMPMSRLGSADLPAPGPRQVVLVCASGRRSEMCAGTVAARTGGAVHLLAGGVAAWRQTGGAVEGSGRHVLPLDRQVLIGAGSVVLAGVGLGTFAHPAFYALSAFAGAGLIVAGTTGFCGMALILARMPWNRVPRPA